MTNKLPKPMTDGIRVVAFLMEDAHIQQITYTIATMVKSHLTDHIDSPTLNMEDMQDAVEHITSATKSITRKIEEANDKLQNTIEQLAQTTQELTEKTMEAMNGNMRAPKVPPATYAAIAQQHLSRMHSDHHQGTYSS